MNKDLSFLKDHLIAHRGMHNIEKGIPENSIKAFKEAIKNNYLIELDVHLLKDNTIIVFHDDNLKRMTGIDKKVKDTTYQEIKKLKLNNTNNTIPTLKQVLDIINGKVPVIIELKCDIKSGPLEKELVKILKDYKGKYAVKSFNPKTIYWFKKNYPNIIRGQLSSDFKNKKMNKIKKYLLKNMLLNKITNPDFISYDIKAIPNKTLNKYKNEKLILSWTIKNKKDLEKAKKYCDNYICENIDEIF